MSLKFLNDFSLEFDIPYKANSGREKENFALI